MSDDHGTSPEPHAQIRNSDSGILRSVDEVPSRPMQNQNVNVNAYKLKHYHLQIRLL